MNSFNNDELTLSDLNEYVLIKIFKFCSQHDLENLYETCTRFHDIIEHIFAKRCIGLLMTATDENSKNNPRTFSKLTHLDRIKISYCWKMGHYKERQLFHCERWFPSKMILERDKFYLSVGGQVRVHKRSEMEIIEQKNWKQISSRTKEIIYDLTKKGDTIFAGRLCGSCFIYDGGDIMEQRLHDKGEDLGIADFHKNVFVTSTHKSTKLWKKLTELNCTAGLEFVNLFEYAYRCLRISGSGNIMIGAQYSGADNAVHEIDIETFKLKQLNCSDVTLYDLVYKDENCIFTANPDRTLRLYDRRTNYNEMFWQTQVSATCLDHDGVNGLICGFKNDGRVNIYDIRMGAKYVQFYLPYQRPLCRGGVFGIACDARYLFAAINTSLRVFDFKYRR